MSVPPDNSGTPAQPAPRLLDSISGPADLKRLPAEQLPRLAQEIREELIDITSANGGHLGPNLGVVELTLALHRVFETPKDRFVFDVSHQGYVHKMLTGRRGPLLRQLRRSGGLSGFLQRDESPHDAFGAGHAGTALSAALGMAVARDLRAGDEHVVAVLGDAALTCGVTLEALNNVAHSTQRLVVVLNDNEWSIAKNVGAIARYLSEVITDPVYNRIHHDLADFLRNKPGLRDFAVRVKESTKGFFMPSTLFEKFGLRYLGPIDGHNLDLLARNLEFARHSDKPVLLHVLTVKGKGYEVAQNQPERFHGLSPFDKSTGQPRPSAAGAPPAYQDVFGRALLHEAQQDPAVVGITAAMPAGTGLSLLAERLPKQCIDVGIAEEHAVVFAAGLATRGIKPVVAIYSTFLQRAFDPIVHDVCLQRLPVTFCLDRAGLSPNDGPTHHGLFDLAYLRCVPHATVMQPKDEDELADMLHTGLQLGAPAFIRYPRGSAVGVAVKAQPAALPVGRAEVLREGSDLSLWALGPWVQEALRLAERLSREAGLEASVVNARFVKPLDASLLAEHAARHRLLVTLEDHVAMGGFGSAVCENLAAAGLVTPVEVVAWPDQFISHGSGVEPLREAHGLSPDAIYSRLVARVALLGGAAAPSALV